MSGQTEVTLLLQSLHQTALVINKYFGGDSTNGI